MEIRDRMKNRTRVMMMTALLLIGAALLLPALGSRRVAAQTPGLNGSYGFTLTQVYSGNNPAAFMGVLTFDGAGNVSANSTIVQVDPDPNASFPQAQTGQQSPGAYTVSADGTGTLTFPNNGRPPSTVPFVITDGGNGLMFLPTAGFGNALLIGTARKQ